MTMATDMQVTLYLPWQVLFDGPAVRLRAEAQNGGFGMLPNHCDFVTALVPSVLLITQANGKERIFGIDEGLLVKIGQQVQVAARRGLEGDDLDLLQDTIGGRFADLEDDERAARAALSRLEADMVRRFATLQEPSL